MLTVFRVDASLRMGTGHVMRCLTLAEELRRRGGESRFICRAMQGDMVEIARSGNYAVAVLPPGRGYDGEDAPPHAAWLETDWRTDAADTIAALAGARPDWMVTDHYALDARWEGALRPSCGRMMVLDDLTDRAHDCDLLVDQTFGRAPQAYHGLTPPGCRVMTGGQYALLRPQFLQLREAALARRDEKVQRVLVSLGGVDPDNCTLAVLQALQRSSLPQGCRVTIVMTDKSLWLEQVRDFVSCALPLAEVLCNVTDMASLMAQADIAIGAGGTTSWERCCLGLPTILVVVAENQKMIAENLSATGAVTAITRKEIAARLPVEIKRLAFDAQARLAMSRAAAAVTDGQGCVRVVDAMHIIRDAHAA